MTKHRVEAFSDAVLAIIITIMVLELRLPAGVEFSALKGLFPVFLSYILSFFYIGIYWNNHHHLLHATTRVNGRILWANLHLLFWISLIPFGTAWMGNNHLETAPIMVYGFVLFMAAVAWNILQWTIKADQGSDSVLRRALGRDWKGRLSPLVYIGAIGFASLSAWIAIALYSVVVVIWLIPDRRIERALRA